MKTPITYYGGKQTMAKFLLTLIPPHKLYCEPFFGGGALFFAKPKSEVEVINDIDGELVNFFQVMKTKFSDLDKEIKATPHSRELFKKARVVYEHPEMFNDVKRAWAFWTLTNQGFAGMTTSWGFGKDNSKEKSLANKREQFSKVYADRLEKVQLESNDALKVIDRCDAKDTFFYIDPPYFNSHQGHYKGYTEEDYVKLLERLGKIKGKFLLSSYPSDVIKKYMKKFKWKGIGTKKTVAVTKLTDKKKVEILVHNYELKAPIKSLSGLNTERMKKNSKKSYRYIGKEIKFIQRFLDFHDKVLYKKTFEIFIDELQRAIQNKEITKKSPVAKDIIAMQKAAVAAYNTMRQAKHFVLKPSTIKKLKKIIENYENDYSESFDEAKEKVLKKKPMDLSGIQLTEEKEIVAKVMPSTEFANLKFNTIGFTGKWLNLIGDPSVGFTAMVFGKPKMGKSYLCIDFAGYLARNHGKVLYVAKEEKLDATLQKKLMDKDVAHENLFVADALPEDISRYDFIFLDSVNKLGLSPVDLENLRKKNPGKSFIFIFQTTKEGNFRGGNEFQHDVDVVIEIPEQGKAVQFGRFNQGGELKIFKEGVVSK